MSKHAFYRWWKKEKEDTSTLHLPNCHADGCTQKGIHKAPKKGIHSHPKKPDTWHWFCLDHVRSYNLEWNYYEEMSEEDILEEWHKDITWQRPSWPLGSWYSNRAIHLENDLYSTEKRQRILEDPFGLFDEQEWGNNKSNIFTQKTPESEAIVLLELPLPFDENQLQTAYRKMVKKYHPDLHQGCLQAEEKLKQINHAYGLLKNIVQLKR